MAPRHKEFDRDEVLFKAMMVFRDKGYEATSMQDLIEQMGINRFSLSHCRHTTISSPFRFSSG
jgi:TetR/AcrR family transcriptional repressor of nem operon